MKPKKEFPDFDKMTRDEEAMFWDTIDIEEYVDLENPPTIKAKYEPDSTDNHNSSEISDNHEDH